MNELIDFDFSERQALGIKQIILDRVRAQLVPELDEIKELIDQLAKVPKKLDVLKARVDAIDRQTVLNTVDISNIAGELGIFERLNTVWGNIGARDCFDRGYFSKKVSAVGPEQRVLVGITAGGAISLGSSKSMQVITPPTGPEIEAGVPLRVSITPYKTSMREIISAKENTLWCRMGFMAKRLDDIGIKVGALREGILPDDVVATIQADWGDVLGFLNALDGNNYTPRDFVSWSVGAIELKGAWRDRLLEVIRGEIPDFPEFERPEPFNLTAGLNAISVGNLEPGGALGSFGSTLNNFLGIFELDSEVFGGHTWLDAGAIVTGDQTATRPGRFIEGGLRGLIEQMGFDIGTLVPGVVQDALNTRGFTSDWRVKVDGWSDKIECIKSNVDNVDEVLKGLRGGTRDLASNYRNEVDTRVDDTVTGIEWARVRFNDKLDKLHAVILQKVPGEISADTKRSKISGYIWDVRGAMATLVGNLKGMFYALEERFDALETRIDNIGLSPCVAE